MDSRLGPRLRNVLLNVANHRQTNLLGTALLTFLALYVSLAALLDRSLFQPVPPPPANSSSEPAPLSQPPPLFPLFLIWALCLCVGHLLSLLFLPPLLGPLLTGVLFANFTALREALPFAAPEWALFIRQFAFLLLLVRSAVGIEFVALQRSLVLCTGLGVLCPLVECVAVVLLAHLLYQVPLSLAILFGFTFVPSSLAVVTPLALRLREQEKGTEGSVLTATIASSCLDNVLAMTGAAIAFDVVSARSDELSYILSRIPMELLVGAILGTLAGVLMRSFPRPDSHYAHFSRTLLLLSTSVAFLFGTGAIDCHLAGPVAVLMALAVASMRWKVDNSRRTRPEENAFALCWDLLLSPLLFFLLGSMLDFSLFRASVLGASFALLGVSLLTRLVCSLLCAFACFGPLNGERTFLAFALAPKTPFAIPLLLKFAVYEQQQGDKGASEEQLAMLWQTSLLALVVTAPIGHLLLRVLAHYLLPPKLFPSVAAAKSLGSPQYARENNGGKFRVTHSDPRDNRLRLELGVNDDDPVDPNDAEQTPSINRQAFRRLFGMGEQQSEGGVQQHEIKL